MSKTPETIVKDEVVAWLKGAGLFYRRMQSGKVKVRGGWVQLCPEGTYDLLVCPAYGLPKWIEIKGKDQKTDRKRQAAQDAFADEVMRLGHRCKVCESLSEVIAFLNG